MKLIADTFCLHEAYTLYILQDECTNDFTCLFYANSIQNPLNP